MSVQPSSLPSEKPKDSQHQSGGLKRKEPGSFTPQGDWELISQGAEARLWKIRPGRLPFDEDPSHHQQQPCIAKERFPKKYRHPVLDERLTKQRCRMEGRILEKCLKNGIAVPKVLRIEAPVLYIEYIDGTTVRNILQGWIEGPESAALSGDNEEATMTASLREKIDHVGRIMGTIIGELHGRGIIHGDLTTSNMMVRGQKDAPNHQPQEQEFSDENAQSILLIDFGLAKNSESAEERAVDLYVLERAIASTHPSLPDSFMDDIILPAYAKVLDASKAKAVLQRLDQVRLRGRKRECFG